MANPNKVKAKPQLPPSDIESDVEIEILKPEKVKKKPSLDEVEKVTHEAFHVGEQVVNLAFKVLRLFKD